VHLLESDTFVPKIQNTIVIGSSSTKRELLMKNTKPLGGRIAHFDHYLPSCGHLIQFVDPFHAMHYELMHCQ